MPRKLWDAMKEPAVLFLLASSRCPGTVIILGLDVAVALKDAPVSIASGFQSPLEKESLKFLLKGSVRLVICPARSAVGMRVPEAWKLAIAANRLSIRSAIDEGFESQRHAAQPDKAPRRPTVALAEQRNRFVAAISDAILILHATSGGKLDRLATELLAEGRKPVWTIDDPANLNLIQQGARPVTATTLQSIWEGA